MAKLLSIDGHCVESLNQWGLETNTGSSFFFCSEIYCGGWQFEQSLKSQSKKPQ
jgi:hypothetical protein